jgi:probable HAF family extracellular repeat protein
MKDLGTLGGSYSVAAAISDSGAVVGSSTLPGDGVQHAFLWTKSKGMQDLGTLGGSDSAANGINKSGEVVGWANTLTGVGGAFLWKSGKGMEKLSRQIPPDSGWLLGSAASINNVGQIAGTGYVKSLPSGNDGRAYLLTPTH